MSDGRVFSACQQRWLGLHDLSWQGAGSGALNAPQSRTVQRDPALTQANAGARAHRASCSLCNATPAWWAPSSATEQQTCS